MNKVFLGGTCAETTWRDELIKVIDVDWFNPVVEDWTPDCIKVENHEKTSLCNIHLYVLTKEMMGVYSVAEVVESVMTKDKVTIFHVMPEGFDTAEFKSLLAVVDLVKIHGGIAYVDTDLHRTARVINSAFKQ